MSDWTVDEVRSSDDVDALWKALLAAKAEGDHALTSAIEGRMRELSPSRRFAHLSDEELDAQIAALRGQREPDVPQAYSPPGSGMADGITDTMRFNQVAREASHVGLERTLADLLDEKARRTGS